MILDHRGSLMQYDPKHITAVIGRLWEYSEMRKGKCLSVCQKVFFDICRQTSCRICSLHYALSPAIYLRSCNGWTTQRSLLIRGKGDKADAIDCIESILKRLEENEVEYGPELIEMGFEK